MKVGAEPKKVVALLALSGLAVYLTYTNLLSSGGAPTPQARTGAAPALPVATETARPVPRAEAPRTRQSRLQEFRPSLRRTRSADPSGLNTMEATLRLDLLDKLQQVSVEGGQRSLFDFGAAPLPKQPEPKIMPKPPVAEAPPAPEPSPSKPRPPQIPLKFFGFTAPFPQGPRRAFFLDGDEILVGGEGEVLKKRYRVVKISVNSVVVEDLQSNSEQTLPLEPQVG